ncbi:hypothetical protein BDV3_002472 [Batrachochytrium dendrobatidis]
MDSALVACVEEVAFDGIQGCSLNRLWSLLELRISKQCQSLDESSNAFEFEAKQSILENEPAKQGMLIDVNMRQFLFRQMLQLRDLAFHHGPLNPKKDAQMLERSDLSNIPFSQLEQAYPLKIYLVASETARFRVLQINKSTVPISDNVFEVLDVIVKGRENGASQSEISKLLAKDPRSTFYTIKVLKKSNLILNYPIVKNKIRTQNCVHRRFIDECKAYHTYMKNMGLIAQLGNAGESSKLIIDSTANSNEQLEFVINPDGIKETIMSLVMGSANQVMAIEDIFLALNFQKTRQARKSFFRIICILVNSQYLDRINIVDPKIKNGTRTVKCVRGNRAYISSSKSTLNNQSALLCSETAQPLSQPSASLLADQTIHTNHVPDSIVCSQPAGRFLSNVPIQKQVYDIIESTGTEGIVISDICKALGGVYLRMLHQITTKMSTNVSTKTPFLTTIADNQLKSHMLRIYSSRMLGMVELDRAPCATKDANSVIGDDDTRLKNHQNVHDKTANPTAKFDLDTPRNLLTKSNTTFDCPIIATDATLGSQSLVAEHSPLLELPLLPAVESIPAPRSKRKSSRRPAHVSSSLTDDSNTRPASKKKTSVHASQSDHPVNNKTAVFDGTDCILTPLPMVEHTLPPMTTRQSTLTRACSTASGKVECRNGNAQLEINAHFQLDQPQQHKQDDSSPTVNYLTRKEKKRSLETLGTHSGDALFSKKQALAPPSNESVGTDIIDKEASIHTPSEAINSTSDTENTLQFTKPIVLISIAPNTEPSPGSSSTGRACEICHMPIPKNLDPSVVVVCCFGCKKWYHGRCRKYKLSRTPIGKWVCSSKCNPSQASLWKQRVLFDQVVRPQLVKRATDSKNLSTTPLNKVAQVDKLLDENSLSGEIQNNTSTQPDTPLTNTPQATSPSLTLSNRLRKSTVPNTHSSRSQIILEYLEAHHVLVISSKSGDILKKFEMERENGNSNLAPIKYSKIDKRTVERAGKMLQSEGKIKLYSFSIMSLTGRTSMKTIMLHGSLTPQSKVVKDHLKILRAEAILKPQTVIKKVMRSSQIQVQRLKRVDQDGRIIDSTADYDNKESDDAMEDTLDGTKTFGNDQFKDSMADLQLNDSHPSSPFLAPFDQNFDLNRIPNFNLNFDSNFTADENIATGSSSDQNMNALQLHRGFDSDNESSQPIATPLQSNLSEVANTCLVRSQQTPSSTPQILSTVNNAVVGDSADILEPQHTTEKLETSRAIAFNYGYMDAKFIRAKIFYEWLFTITVLNPIMSSHSNSADEGHAAEKDGVRTNRIVESLRFFSELPFDIFVKCIGLCSQSSIADAIMSSPNYSTLSIGNIEPSIRPLIYNSRLRKGLNLILSDLCSLGLVHASDETGTVEKELEKSWMMSLANMPQFFRVERRAGLFDYSMMPPLLIRHIDIRSVSDVASFWIRLENQCLAHSTNYFVDGHKLQSKIKAYESDIDNANGQSLDQTHSTCDLSQMESQSGKPYSLSNVFNISLSQSKLQHSLFHTRNWRVTYRFTTAQIAVLMSKIDRKNGTTPWKNDLICHALAVETGLIVPRIKSFYRKYQEKLLSQKQMQQIRCKQQNENKARKFLLGIRKHQLSTQAALSGTDNAVSTQMPTDDSKSKDIGFKTAQRARVKSKVSRVIRPSRIAAANALQRVGFSDDAIASRLPLSDSSQSEYTRYNTDSISKLRIRHAWTPEEDRMILMGHTILLHRFYTGRISWIPISKLFESSKNYDTCRRRFVRLCKSLENVKLLYMLRRYWPRIYEQGLSDNAFENQSNVKPSEFKLVDMVTYFQASISEDSLSLNCQLNNSNLNVKLPSNYETLMNEYTFSPIQGELSKEFRVPLNDGLDLCTSTRMRMAIMYCVPITLTNSDSTVPDFPKSTYLESMADEDSIMQYIEHNKLQTIVKAILLTPSSLYIPAQVFLLLTCFSSDRLSSAISSLRSDGLITYAGLVDHRRLPGRQYNLTEKFLLAITGPLRSQMIPETFSAWNLIQSKAQNGPWRLNNFFEGPMVAALLSCAVSGDIHIDVEIKWDASVGVESQNVFIDVSLTNNGQNTPPTLGNTTTKRPTASLKSANDNEELPSHSNSDTLKRICTDLNQSLHHESTSNSKNAALLNNLAILKGASAKDTDVNKLLDEACSFRSDANGAYLRLLFDAIETAGIIGKTYTQLQELSYTDYTAFSLDIHLDILKSIVVSVHVPMISKVGFKTFQYVAFPYAHHWHSPIMPDIESESPSRLDTSLAYYPIEDTANKQTRSNLCDDVLLHVPTRLWTNSNGSRLDAVWLACLESTLGVIVCKPGIYESRIQKGLAYVLTPVELHEVLDELVLRRLCTRERYTVGKQLENAFDGLFNTSFAESQKYFFQSQENSFQSSNTVTAYFPTTDWFKLH